jgi:hypothetical protein
MREKERVFFLMKKKSYSQRLKILNFKHSLYLRTNIDDDDDDDDDDEEEEEEKLRLNFYLLMNI